MAITHISYTVNSQHGTMLQSALSDLENGLTGLNQILGAMQTMIDGDGSQASQFTEVVAQFGLLDLPTAKAAWDELNSLASKLNTDASVSSVHAALIQAFNKFR